jgi:hypothetical protein
MVLFIYLFRGLCLLREEKMSYDKFWRKNITRCNGKPSRSIEW